MRACVIARREFAHASVAFLDTPVNGWFARRLQGWSAAGMENASLWKTTPKKHRTTMLIPMASMAFGRYHTSHSRLMMKNRYTKERLLNRTQRTSLPDSFGLIALFAATHLPLLLPRSSFERPNLGAPRRLFVHGTRIMKCGTLR